jgi:hypothetical protein
MQSQAQMAYWQRTVKLQPSKINSYLPSVMDFTLYEATTAFNEDDGGWERNDEIV